MANCVSKIKPEKDRVFIYTLSHPITNEIRYIGKTKQSLYNRYADHISIKNNRNKLNYHSKNWIKSLLKDNLKPKIELLDIVDEFNWEIEEIFYISYFRYLGFNLINYQKGGKKGNTGLKWKLSDNTKKNKFEILKNSKINKHILYDLKGNVINKYDNIIIASELLNIQYAKLYQIIKYKNLIDKKFILLKEEEEFNTNLLKRKCRKILIYNNTEELIFNSQKECSKYLKLSLSTINQIVNNKITNNTCYKFKLL